MLTRKMREDVARIKDIVSRTAIPGYKLEVVVMGLSDYVGVRASHEAKKGTLIALPHDASLVQVLQALTDAVKLLADLLVREGLRFNPEEREVA